MGLRDRLHRPTPATEPPVAVVDPPAPASSPKVDEEARQALIDRAEAAMEAGRNLEAIEDLRVANRMRPAGPIERRLVRARHLAFDEILGEPGHAEWPPPFPDLTPGIEGLPEVPASELTAEVLGSALVHHGALIVRKLAGPEDIAPLIEGIDKAFAGYDAWYEEEKRWTETQPWFAAFQPLNQWRQSRVPRGWVRDGGGVSTADSPRVCYQLLETFEKIGLRDTLTGYLGERPAISVKKATLRRVPTHLKGADWHQDGAFLGQGIRSVNVWLSLTHCGGDTPTAGLDVVPRRIDHLLPTGTEGAIFDWSVGPGVVEREAAEAPVERPEFLPGDALLFDDLFLHRTGVPEVMSEERYAVENWFFAPSCYPPDQIPLVF